MNQSTPTIQSALLHYREGNSDKEYHAAIEPRGGGGIVTFAYGRRGTTLIMPMRVTIPAGTIPHDEYIWELQKVKMFIADSNVFGVDLNPTAVEPAEISLWLNTIYEGAFVLWFGLQLACGNSLIGARRETYPTHLLLAQTGKGGTKARLGLGSVSSACCASA